MSTEVQQDSPPPSLATARVLDTDEPQGLGALLAERVTPVDRGAALVVLAHLLPVWWLVVSGGLYLDDLRAQAYARNQPFWGFIWSSNGTHLAPGPRTLDWLQMQYAPLEQWPAVLVTLIVHLALGAAAWFLLRELVGARFAALLPLTLLLLTPALVSATAWYRQTLTTLIPLTLVLVAGLAAVRLVRGGRRRWGAISVGLVAIAMLFSERALAGCSFVVALAVLVPVVSGAARRARVIGLTVPLAVLAVVYVVIYRSGPFDQGTTGGLDLGDFGDLLVRSIGESVVPALFGGPWNWTPSGPALSVAAPPVALVVACNLVVWGGLAALVRRTGSRGRVVRGLLIAASYVAPIEVFVFVGRYAGFGSTTGSDLRLFADCAVVLVVALALVFLGWDRVPGQPRHSRAVRRPALLRLVAAFAVVAVGTGTAVSWAQFGQRWHTNPTAAYVSALRHDLDRAGSLGADGTMTVLPGLIPDNVIPAWMQTEISSLDIVALLRPTTEQALSLASLRSVALDGHLEPGTLTTVERFATGEDNFCHHPQQANTEQPLVIDADEVVAYKRDELIELGMLVNDERTVLVDVVDPDGKVTPLTWPRPTIMQRGPYTARLRVPYGVDVASVQIRPGPASMCIVSVIAVTPVEPR